MANVSDGIQIETRKKHDLSIPFQSVTGNQSLNVGTLLVGHTGSTGWGRLARPPIFDGPVLAGRHYVLVDDFVGQGGTLANLRGLLVAGGGNVGCAITLTGKSYSAKLTLESETLRRLRQKHGPELETWWQETFGYGFDRLTESEARYLLRAENADTIRARLLEARS